MREESGKYGEDELGQIVKNRRGWFGTGFLPRQSARKISRLKF